MDSRSITFIFRDLHAVATHFKTKASFIRTEMKEMQSGSDQHKAALNQAVTYEDVAFTLFHAELAGDNSYDKEG